MYFPLNQLAPKGMREGREQLPPIGGGEWFKTATPKYYITNDHKSEFDKLC